MTGVNNYSTAETDLYTLSENGTLAGGIFTESVTEADSYSPTMRATLPRRATPAPRLAAEEAGPGPPPGRAQVLVRFSGLEVSQMLTLPLFVLAAILPPQNSFEFDLLNNNVKVRRECAKLCAFHYQNCAPKYFGSQSPPIPPEFYGPTKTMPILLFALRDPDPEVRDYIATIFRFFTNADVGIPILVDLLKDNEVSVRRTAAETLLELESLSQRELPEMRKALKFSLPSLMSRMKDNDKTVSIYSAALVAGLEANAEKPIRFLMAFANDNDKRIRAESARVFRFIGIKGIPIIKEGLSDKSPIIRRWTIRALDAMNDNFTTQTKFPTDMISPLVAAINDDNDEVVISAIHAVSSIGIKAKEAVPLIIKRFNHSNIDVRWCAIRHVNQFGISSLAAIPALKLVANDDKSELVRETASDVLKSLEKRALENSKKDK